MLARLIDLPNYAALIPDLPERGFLVFKFSQLDCAGFEAGARAVNR
jgi:hypothetical protein